MKLPTVKLSNVGFSEFLEFRMVRWYLFVNKQFQYADFILNAEILF